jgi:hypothetical protein
MRDYFLVTQGDSFCSIRSGLWHTDKEIKSPFLYERTIIGKNCLKESIHKFEEWYKGVLEVNAYYEQMEKEVHFNRGNLNK